MRQADVRIGDQSSVKRRLPLTIPAPSAVRFIKTWDWGVRLFHWLLVAAIAVAFLSSEEGSALSAWHVPAGWVAAILIVFRLVWGLVGGEHARFANLIRPSRMVGHVRGLFAGRVHASLGHNPLGGIAVLVLLALVAATAVTGPRSRRRHTSLFRISTMPA